MVEGAAVGGTAVAETAEIMGIDLEEVDTSKLDKFFIYFCQKKGLLRELQK